MSAAVTPAPPPVDVVPFFKALADETRLAIVRMLALTDLRVGEVVARLQAPQNVVSYHLKQLRALGLLRDHRSSADARDVYYGVDLARLEALYLAAGAALHPGIAPVAHAGRAAGPPRRPLRVLFLCTHNSARSQLAEALLRHLGGGDVAVRSAGSVPTAVHPDTLATLARWGIDATGLTAKSLDRFLGRRFDYVITVCDRARDRCPTFPDDPWQLHWSIPDPAAIDDADARRRAFEGVRRELDTRIRYLLRLPPPRTGERPSLAPTPGAPGAGGGRA